MLLFVKGCIWSASIVIKSIEDVGPSSDALVPFIIEKQVNKSFQVCYKKIL